MQQAELSLLFLRPLNQLGVRYVVAGSTASMLYSEPRFTNDLDLVVFLRHEDIHRLGKVFAQPDFCFPPAEVVAAEIERPHKGQFNVVHISTGFKADFYTTGRDDFNAWAFRHARRIEFKGETIAVAPPECVIVRKLEFLREGGSDKHVRDIRAMLRVSGDLIDRGALREWIVRQGVEAEWKRIE